MSSLYYLLLFIQFQKSSHGVIKVGLELLNLSDPFFASSLVNGTKFCHQTVFNRNLRYTESLYVNETYKMIYLLHIKVLKCKEMTSSLSAKDHL